MIDRIKKFDLCIGCGLCESIIGKQKCELALNDKGFYEPIVTSRLTKDEEKLVKVLCPGIHIETKNCEGAWGSMLEIDDAWSCDREIRHKAASGGVITSLAIFLLEQHHVDAVLQVGVKSDSYLYNEIKVSRTREEIVQNAQSRYAPALVLNRIKQILDSTNDKYVFIGKPCDIAAVKNMLSVFPQYEGRILYFLSIFCAGIPSYKATEKVWKQSGKIEEPLSLRYRGEGWPGNFCAKFPDGTDYQISYNDSWGKVLGRNLGFRCKICPDGIGMLADIAVGDSWNTKNGYPDFTESEGRCFCMIRTQRGRNIFREAIAQGYIQSEKLDINKVKEQQKYQYERRKRELFRLIPVQLLTGGLLRFKGLGIYGLAFKSNPIKGLRDSLGTWKRFKAIINGQRS
jgi:coenzyme F420 hydrogenase subunit beta